MELWLESCIVVLAVLSFYYVSDYIWQKGGTEIHAALPRNSNTDTNTPITLSLPG